MGVTQKVQSQVVRKGTKLSLQHKKHKEIWISDFFQEVSTFIKMLTLFVN